MSHLKLGPALVAGFAALWFTLAPAQAGPAREAIVTAQLANAVEVIDLASGKGGAPSPSMAPRRASPSRRIVASPTSHAPKATASPCSTSMPGRCARRSPCPAGRSASRPTRGDRVYVADWYGSRIFVLSGRDGALSLDGEIAVGKSPSGIAVSPDGAKLYVANREADTVSVVDAAARREIAAVIPWASIPSASPSMRKPGAPTPPTSQVTTCR